MTRPSKFAAVLLAAAFGQSLPAQTPKADPPETPKAAGDLRKPQEANAKLFRELAQGLLRLAQKLERSDKPEDQERAKTIRSALKVAEDSGVENQFTKLIAAMGKGANGLQEFDNLRGQDAELAKALQEIVNILMTDDDSAKIKAEIARLTEILKEVKDIKRREEIIRAMTEAQKGDAAKIAKQQADLAQQTKDLADRIAGKKGDAGPKPESKSDPKSEAKPGDQSAEPKKDTGEQKSTDKDGDAKAGEAKDAAGKDGAEAKPAGDPKAGEPKAGEPKAGEPKAGEPKAGEPKAGEPKAGEPKAGEPKAGEPKASEPKAGEPKAGEPKGDAKGEGDGKAEGKPASDAKPGEGKGSGAEPSDAKGEAKGGGGPPGPPGGSGSPPPGGLQPPSNDPPGRKQIQEAYPSQKGAEEDLKKQDRNAASKKESKAIEDLAKAIDELEKRLKQLREEELLKTLAALEARCSRMLAMQIEVYENTKGIHAVVVKNMNVKTTADIQKSQTQASKENEIIVEADRAMKLLETEGSAVVFAGVLEEVRGDMAMVQKRLDGAVVDTDTQSIEENIIAMLKEMIQALKKQQQDINDNKDSPPPGPPGKQGPQPLIDLLAELRLVRALQVQVNQRTAMYGKKSASEQAADPIVQAEFKEVAKRQANLQDKIHKIATKANQ